MILIWRGWGLLGIVALFPMLGVCAGLADLDSKMPLFLGVCGALLLGGGVCVYFGTLWNRGRAEHTLYFVPLEVCGWIYLAGAAGLSLLLGAGAALAGLGVRRGPPQPGLLGMGVGGTILFLLVIATGVWLIRVARRRPHLVDDEPDFLDRDESAGFPKYPPSDRPETDYSRFPKFDR